MFQGQFSSSVKIFYTTYKLHFVTSRRVSFSTCVGSYSPSANVGVLLMCLKLVSNCVYRERESSAKWLSLKSIFRIILFKRYKDNCNRSTLIDEKCEMNFIRLLEPSVNHLFYIIIHFHIFDVKELRSNNFWSFIMVLTDWSFVLKSSWKKIFHVKKWREVTSINSINWKIV